MQEARQARLPSCLQAVWVKVVRAVPPTAAGAGEPHAARAVASHVRQPAVLWVIRLLHPRVEPGHAAGGESGSGCVWWAAGLCRSRAPAAGGQLHPLQPALLAWKTSARTKCLPDLPLGLNQPVQREKTLTGHTDAVRALTVAGNKVFSASYDGTLKVGGAAGSSWRCYLGRKGQSTAAVQGTVRHQTSGGLSATLQQAHTSFLLVNSWLSPRCGMRRT